MLKYFAACHPGILPPALATPFAPMQAGAAPITPMAAVPEVIFSGKHNGICIYFSRILGWVNPWISPNHVIPFVLFFQKELSSFSFFLVL